MKPYNIKYVIAGLIIVIMLAGIVSCTGDKPEKASDNILHYTCGMHPSVKVTPEEYNSGAKCPICNMDLVPVYKNEEHAHMKDDKSITLSSRQQSLAEVETVEVKPLILVKEINTVGKMDYDERGVSYVTSRVAGRLDKLFVNYTGVKVNKGDPLALIYSPDLVSTQQEYLLALETLDKVQGSNIPEVIVNAESLVHSTRNRLLLWGISEKEIERLEAERKTSISMTVYSPMSGTVVKKDVQEGHYVKEGSHLYTIVDLSQLWMFADVYEYEMAWVKTGDMVDIVTLAYPGQVFTGKITFVDPVLNPQTRSVKIRANFSNRLGKLKPEMFVNAGIKVQMTPKRFPHMAASFEKKSGKNVTEHIATYRCDCNGETWTQKASDKKSCPFCGEAMPDCGTFIKQEEKKVASIRTGNEILAIPVGALLDTGRRKLVYVEKTAGDYEPREIKVGPRAGGYYPVMKGLKDGERVVTKANFLIDSQSQLTGQESAVYDSAIGAGHKH